MSYNTDLRTGEVVGIIGVDIEFSEEGGAGEASLEERDTGTPISIAQKKLLVAGKAYAAGKAYKAALHEGEEEGARMAEIAFEKAIKGAKKKN
jgi:hypothetical protein